MATTQVESKRFLPCLLSKYLNSAQRNQINELNLITVEQFVSIDHEELYSQSNKLISKEELNAIQQEIKGEYKEVKLSSLFELNLCIPPPSILFTGTEIVNELLIGGIYTQELTEIVGASAVGKTQFCLQLASETSLNGQVIYIDTQQSFSLDRIKDLVKHYCTVEKSKNPTESVKNIAIYKVFNLFQLFSFIQTIENELISQSNPLYSNVKLIIIDSLASLISVNLGNSKKGHSISVQLIRLLKSMAQKFNLAIVATNYTVNAIHTENKPQFDTINSISNSTQLKPALGESWSYLADTRILMEELNSNSTNKVVLSTNSNKPTVYPNQQISLSLVKSPRVNTTYRSIHAELTSRMGIQPIIVINQQ